MNDITRIGVEGVVKQVVNISPAVQNKQEYSFIQDKQLFTDFAKTSLVLRDKNIIIINFAKHSGVQSFKFSKQYQCFQLKVNGNYLKLKINSIFNAATQSLKVIIENENPLNFNSPLIVMLYHNDERCFSWLTKQITHLRSKEEYESIDIEKSPLEVLHHRIKLLSEAKIPLINLTDHDVEVRKIHENEERIYLNNHRITFPTKSEFETMYMQITEESDSIEANLQIREKIIVEKSEAGETQIYDYWTFWQDLWQLTLTSSARYIGSR